MATATKPDERPGLALRGLARVRAVLALIVSSRVREFGPVVALLALLASMSESDVTGMVDLLAGAGCPVWLAGGWGVDALAGRRTRRHEDLDLLIAREHMPAALATLAGRGLHEIQTGIVEGALMPERVIVQDAMGRTIDLHPVDLEQWLAGPVAERVPDAPDAHTAAFATGTLAGRPVPCLSRALQLSAHAGYAPRAVDRRDIALLRGGAE